MADQDETIKNLVKDIRVSDTPCAPVTREELEQRAKAGAEEEAKQAYDTAYDDAYRRILDELLEEHDLTD